MSYRPILLLILLLVSPVFGQNADTLNDGKQTLANIPWTSDADIARSAWGASTGHGVVPTGEYPTARQQIATNYWGDGIRVGTNGRIFDCISWHNDVGARLLSSDSEIRSCRLHDNRDACLWIAASAGNCQSFNTHCHGGRVACYNEGGEAFRSTNDTYADSEVGYFGDVNGGGSGNTSISNALITRNNIRDVYFRAWACRLTNCTVNVQREVAENATLTVGNVTLTGKVGIQLDGPEGSVRGCDITLTGFKQPGNTYTANAATAVLVNSDSCEIIDNRFVDADGLDGSILMRIAPGHHGITVSNCTVRGFQQDNDRLLVIDDAVHTNGLDITFRVNGITKPIGKYVTTDAGWTGFIRLFDTTTGIITTLPTGQATR